MDDRTGAHDPEAAPIELISFHYLSAPLTEGWCSGGRRSSPA